MLIASAFVNMNALTCVTENDLRTLKIICDNKKELERVDGYGNTALLKACYLGRSEAVKMLLRAGANFKTINNLGKNILLFDRKYNFLFQ